LIGGLCFTNAARVVSLPVPEGLSVVVVHPQFVLETRVARAALAVPFAIAEFVHQADYLASFLIALYQNDLNLLRASLHDVLVEPKRAPLIPGFGAVKAAALALGAIGSSISGAGPSVFAWFENPTDAERAGVAMKAAFQAHDLAASYYVASVAGRGARLL
jgi:homoserine kinase